MIAIHRLSDSIFHRAWYLMITAGMVTLAVMTNVHTAAAIGLVYVDADDGFTSGIPNL